MCRAFLFSVALTVLRQPVARKLIGALVLGVAGEALEITRGELGRRARALRAETGLNLLPTVALMRNGLIGNPAVVGS